MARKKPGREGGVQHDPSKKTVEQKQPKPEITAETLDQWLSFRLPLDNTYPIRGYGNDTSDPEGRQKFEEEKNKFYADTAAHLNKHGHNFPEGNPDKRWGGLRGDDMDRIFQATFGKVCRGMKTLDSVYKIMRGTYRSQSAFNWQKTMEGQKYSGDNLAKALLLRQQQDRTYLSDEYSRHWSNAFSETTEKRKE